MVSRTRDDAYSPIHRGNSRAVRKRDGGPWDAGRRTPSAFAVESLSCSKSYTHAPTSGTRTRSSMAVTARGVQFWRELRGNLAVCRLVHDVDDRAARILVQGQEAAGNLRGLLDHSEILRALGMERLDIVDDEQGPDRGFGVIGVEHDLHSAVGQGEGSRRI